MAHSDDEGLVLPPKLAPLQVVIIPIFNKDEATRAKIDQIAHDMITTLKQNGIRVKYDNDDNTRPGFKFAEYELKGVPVRVTLGARDIENGIAEVARRDTKEKENYQLDTIAEKIPGLLASIQANMYDTALKFRAENTTEVNSWDEFVKVLDEKPGFISAHWDGTGDTEEKIKELTKATIRCIPLNNKMEEGKCILTGNPSAQRVLFARAY